MGKGRSRQKSKRKSTRKVRRTREEMHRLGLSASTRAAAKLAAKGVDLLVATDVAEPGSGFGTDTNRVTILDREGGRTELPMLSKREVADRILDRVARALDDRDAGVQTGAATRPSRGEAVPASHGRAAR